MNAEAGKDQAGACLFRSLAAAHQEPQSRRVNVGHAGKIEDELPSTGIGKVLYLLAQKRSVAARQEFPRQTHDRHVVLEADGNSHNPALTSTQKEPTQVELTCYEVEESLSSAAKKFMKSGRWQVISTR